MFKKNVLISLILLNSAFSQDFFEDDFSDSAPAPTYELNGFFRGAIFGGKAISSNDADLKSGYGELGLKLRVRKGEWGDGYAEVRVRRGSEFGQPISEIQLREAYVNAYWGRLDVRLGQQIVVWGRADGFNPTNNITPQNMIARSTDEDDRKIANFLIRTFYNLDPVRFEAIWVPFYAPSVLPTKFFPFPDRVTLGPDANPDSRLKNGSIAFKTELALSKLDGSVSYFRGYMPMPGINLVAIDLSQGFVATVAKTAYQMQVVGADFSSTLGSLGIRGEFGYRNPVEDYRDETRVYLPNPDIQYILGLDKAWGDLTVMTQYIGRYVLDFEAYEPLGIDLDELYVKNRMIASQQEKISHAAFIRPALSLRHETMTVEMLTYYNLSTEELLFRPLLTVNLADALTLKVGAELYSGSDNTLFGAVQDALSSGFVELKASF